MPSRTGLQDVPSSIYWTASIGPFPEISKAFLPDDRKSNSDFPRSSEIEKANLTSHPRGGAPSNPTWNGTRTVPYTLPDEVPLPIMWSVRPRALGFHSGVFSRAFPSDMVPVADLRPPPLAICRQRVKPIVSGAIARPSSKLQHRRKITDKKQRQASLPQRLHSQRLHSEQLHPERADNKPPTRRPSSRSLRSPPIIQNCASPKSNSSRPRGRSRAPSRKSSATKQQSFKPNRETQDGPQALIWSAARSVSKHGAPSPRSRQPAIQTPGSIILAVFQRPCRSASLSATVVALDPWAPVADFQ